MELANALKQLANGLNPADGKPMPPESLTHRAETIRILFALSDEFDSPRALKRKMTIEEKRQRNLSESKPANSNFP